MLDVNGTCGCTVTSHTHSQTGDLSEGMNSRLLECNDECPERAQKRSGMSIHGIQHIFNDRIKQKTSTCVHIYEMSQFLCRKRSRREEK